MPSPLARSVVLGALALSSAAASSALAQSSDDLFAPAPAAENPRPPPVPSGAPPAVPPAPPANPGGAAEARAAARERDRALGPGEREGSLEDRVKAVQRKSFVKAHRLAITGYGAASISDAFFQKWGGGGQLAYAFSDPFALSLNYAYFHDQTTENVLLAKQVLSSQLYVTRLRSLAMADLQWTPLYGKAQLGNKIVYFDFYPFAGLGAVDGETDWIPAGEVGLGERVYLNDFLSVGLEAKYAFYVDQASGGPSLWQRVLLVSAMVTLWIPGGSESP